MNKKYISISKLSLLMVVGLLLISNINRAQNNKLNNVLPPWTMQSAQIKEEIVSKRSQFTKHFLMQDGSIKMYSSPGAIHYKSGSSWKEINLTIQANQSGRHANHPYYNGDNTFKTYYPQNLLNDQIITSLQEGEMSEKVEAMYAVDQNDNIVYQYAHNATAGIAVEGAKISYNNIFTNAIVNYSQKQDGRKFDIVLKNKQAVDVLPSNAQYIVIQEKVIIPSGWTVSQSEHGIDLYKGATYIANLPTPIAYEQESATKEYNEMSDAAKEGSLSFKQNGNEITLFTKFAVSWLKNQDRVFPLTLDPVVNYYPTIGVSMYTGAILSVPGVGTVGSGAKATGNVRITGGGTVAWAKFNISTLPAGVTITSAKYFGYHYNGTPTAGGPLTKTAFIVGLQNTDPVPTTTDSIALYKKITFNSPVYNSNFVFGLSPLPTGGQWLNGVLGGTARGDIAAQQAQGWTALGFRISGGYLGAILQYGNNAASPGTLNCYLELNYTNTACTAAPTAGAATSSVPSACGTTFTLDLTGNTTDTGIVYQWQSSPAGLNTWTNYGAPQSASAKSATQSVATDYQCIVTCTSAGLSATSSVVAVGQLVLNSCYCIPVGTAGSTATPFSYYISGVAVTGASTNFTNSGTVYSTASTSAGSGVGYGNYTATLAAAVPTTTFTVTVTLVGGSQSAAVFIDWNQDGDFQDSLEIAGANLVAVTTTTTAFSITVPAFAAPGTTRMRVRNVSTGTAQACGDYPYSETEDYSLNVIAACSGAGASTVLQPTPNTVCPLLTKVITATGPPFSLGITYQWKESLTSGGPYTNVVGGTGANSPTAYTTAPLTIGTHYFVLETTCANCSPCTVLSNEVSIIADSVLAPIATNSSQCAPGVAAGFVTSANSPAISTGNYYWYTAPTGGTAIQTQPYGPLLTYYSNNFTSSTLTGASLSPTATISGGQLALHTPATANIYGAFMVNASGYNSDKYKISFDVTTVGTPTNMADGFSYSFSNDGVITNQGAPTLTTMNAENGTGTKLKLCFVAYSSPTSPAGIYIFYNNSTIEPAPTATIGLTPTSLGAGYSSDLSWRGTANNHVELNIDSLGKVSLLLNSNVIFSNLSLPAAYLASSNNKASWTHIFKGRTGAITMSTYIDNLEIQQSQQITGWPSYLTPISSTTTLYVSELGSNGCASPRVPITLTVNTPPTITPGALPNDSVCTGAPVTLTATGASTYLWNGNSTTVNGDTTFASAVAGTYTVTGTDANGCVNTSTILVYLHPVVSGTASASPNAFCLGDSTTLSATATPLCTGLNTQNFLDYYAPTSWTFTNTNTNGTTNFAGAPANVKLNTGTSGPGTGGFSKFSRVITCSGTVSFNWSFYHPIDAFHDIPSYQINSGTVANLPGYDIASTTYPATQTGTVSIAVNAGDTLNIIVETDDNDADAGILTMTNFSAPSPEISGLISFFDAPTGGTNLGVPPITVTPSTSGTVTYYAEYTSSTTGCPNPIRQPAAVQVHALPTATVSGGGTICAGSTLPDVSIALTGSSPWSFDYSDGTTTTTVTNTSNNPYIISNATPGTYTASNVIDLHCSGSSSGSATVIVNPLPTAIVSGGGAVCAGTTLPDVSIDLTGASPWSLTYTDGTTPVTINSILTSPYTITGAVGSYSVTNVTDSNNCSNTGSGNVDVISNPLPNVTATVSPSTVCQGSTAVAMGSGAIFYVWDNGIIDGQDFVANATTTYSVIGTDANNCSAISSVTLTVNNNTNDLAQASSGNLQSNTGSQNNIAMQPDDATVIYSDPSCNLIATIHDNIGGNVLGATTSIVNVEPSVMTYPSVGGQPYTRRWYEITPSNNVGVDANVTLYQTQADFDDYNANNGTYPDLPVDSADLVGIANIRITKVSGGPLGVGTAGVITPSSVIWNTAKHYWEINFNVSGTFSSFFFHAANPAGAALSATIINFSGRKEGNNDLLQWTSANEQNNAFFNLQHSTNGIDFITIDKVNSKANGGNSSSSINYQSVHLNPSIGHNYYRLEQVDIDGKKSINAKIVDLIWNGNGSSVSIYPNPAKEIVNIDLFSSRVANTTIKVMDISGRLVKQVQASSQVGLNNMVLNIHDLANGIYTIQILENNVISFTEKIRKD